MDTGLDSPIREAIHCKRDHQNRGKNIKQLKVRKKRNRNSVSTLKVISKLTEARSLLDTPDVSLSKVVAAKDRISEGIDLIQERQKLIKLSDSSELRWHVVQENITNSIADDSEEEKRMNRAQSSFERKSKAEKAKKGPRPVRFPYNKDRTSDGKNSTYKPGRCFTCGNRGHWSDNCPQNKKTKISTLSLLSLNNDLGICTVDRFDTHYNSQCERFNSKVWCPGTEAEDAFTQFWGNDVNWLVPPPIVITKTLNKLEQDKA
ncbi:unnamed protein product [Mytilus edulis]|uniref:CCHC-type domain-containing protein n=1 Tax=Mytilus edulis TaxID=6550 RepID=A0A8S3R6M4_MYTED|nr:unnamed protein product [Mytilus edulis]